MDTKSFALPLNTTQLRLVERALNNLPLHSEAEIQACEDTMKYIGWLSGLVSGATDLYCQVLGWYPGASQWTHLFTWRFRAPILGLDQAARDGVPRGYSHFLIVPIPQEEITK